MESQRLGRLREIRARDLEAAVRGNTMKQEIASVVKSVKPTC